MRYNLVISGSGLLSLGSPSIIPEGWPQKCVDLNEWINFTQQSPRLREILREGERPTAIYKSLSGEEIEVIYVLGRVGPAQWIDRERVGILQELVDHLNDFTGEK